MINLALPEPAEKTCVNCHRSHGKMNGKLIHWPSESFAGETTWQGINPFSVWLYTCQWCRGAETKRKKRGVK